MSWAGLILNVEPDFADVGYRCLPPRDFYMRLIDEVTTCMIRRGVSDKDVRRGSEYYVDRIRTVLGEVLKELLRLRDKLMTGTHSSSAEHDPDSLEDSCLHALRGLGAVRAILLTIPAEETPGSAREFLENLSRIREELEEVCIMLNEVEPDYSTIIDKLEYVIQSIHSIREDVEKLERIVSELLSKVDPEAAARLLETLIRTHLALSRLQVRIREQ